jgi:hypothetical protein
MPNTDTTKEHEEFNPNCQSSIIPHQSYTCDRKIIRLDKPGVTPANRSTRKDEER